MSTPYRGGSYRIAVVGAQFGEPALFLRWLQETFDAEARQVQVGEHDGIYEAVVPGPSPVRAAVATPAHWKPESVYEYVFRDPPDAVLLVLTAVQSVQHTNAMAIGWARPHLDRLGITPVVIVNAPHGRHPNFPTFSARRVCTDHGLPWPARDTMIGTFLSPKLLWSVGAEETWNALLEQSRARDVADGVS